MKGVQMCAWHKEHKELIYCISCTQGLHVILRVFYTRQVFCVWGGVQTLSKHTLPT